MDGEYGEYGRDEQRGLCGGAHGRRDERDTDDIRRATLRVHSDRK